MILEALLEKFKGQTYSQYLTTDEWATKRDEIIKRDNCRCTFCEKSTTIDHFNSDTKKMEHIWFEENGLIDLGEGALSTDFIVINADKHYHLEVHHKRYILNRLPWEYNNDDLITLCNHCHTEFHQNNKVPVYSEDEQVEVEYEVCDRCNGTGYISQYIHVQGGICFQCVRNRYLQLLIKQT